MHLVCEGDAALPASLQLQFAVTTGSKAERCTAGHMVMLKMPERVVKAIMDAAEAGSEARRGAMWG